MNLENSFSNCGNNDFKTRDCCPKIVFVIPTGPTGPTGVPGIGPTGPTERLFKSSNRIIINSS